MASPYDYPGTGVFRNKPGIRNKDALRLFEYEAGARRTDELRVKPIAGSFDLQHLKAIHKFIFQDVYDWAGELRTVDIAKGYTQFARPAFIESEGKRLSALLVKENHLRDLPRDKFVERLTDHYAEWNALHPFREGNGRATRAFFAALVRQAAYDFDNTRILNNEGQWNNACEKSFHGDLAPLQQILNVAIHKR